MRIIEDGPRLSLLLNNTSKHPEHSNDSKCLLEVMKKNGGRIAACFHCIQG